MKTIRSTRLVTFDVDETLVLWDWRKLSPDGVGLIDLKSPNAGTNISVLPHYRHIELLKQFKARGHTVVVWSQGGHEWAERVVLALGLEAYVDYAMDKPNWYVDDLDSSVWMKQPIFLDPTNPENDNKWGLPDEER